MFFEQLAQKIKGDLSHAGGGRWLYYPDDSPMIVQMELMQDSSLLIYSSFARDGSGLFLSSFLTVLLTEDIHAVLTPPQAFGSSEIHCVAVSVSVTFFNRFRVANPCFQRFADGCMIFARHAHDLAFEYLDDIELKDQRLSARNLSDSRLTHLLQFMDDV